MNDHQLRPNDLSPLDRMRLKLLIQFVVEIMKEERTDLLFRDALGIAISWGVSTIPYPTEA